MSRMFSEDFDPLAQLQHCMIEVDSHSATISNIIKAHNNLGSHVADLYEQNAQIARELHEINQVLRQLRDATQ